jgi:hypothetical protein
MLLVAADADDLLAIEIDQDATLRGADAAIAAFGPQGGLG